MSEKAPWEDYAPAAGQSGAVEPWAEYATPERRAKPRGLPKLDNGQVDTTSPEFQVANALEIAKMAKKGGQADPLAGMGNLEKLRAATGAGMHNFTRGLRDVYTDTFGSDEDKSAMDEEISRARQENEYLKANTTGGRAAEFLGEIAPTLLPGGLITKGLGMAAKAVPVANALSKLGVVGKMLPGAIDAATQGGVFGAAQATEGDESRGMNAAIGAGLGAALPIGWAGAKALTRTVTGGGGKKAAAEILADAIRKGTPSADLAGADAAAGGAASAGTDAAAGAAAPGGVRGFLARSRQKLSGEPEDLQSLLDQLDNAQTNIDLPGGGQFKQTTAAALKNAELARHEIGSRTVDPSNWQAGDIGRAQTVAGAFRRYTGESSAIKSRGAARETNWQAGEKALGETVNHDAFNSGLDELREMIPKLKASPEYLKDGVGPLVDKLATDINRGDLTPQHLMAIRQNFNSKIVAGKENAYANAPVKNLAVKDIKGRLDQILDDASGGQYSNINKQYGADVASENAAKAAQRVRSVYYDPVSGMPRGQIADYAGETPAITAVGIMRGIKASRAGQDSAEKLSGEASGGLAALVRALRSQDTVRLAKKTATMGGGSDTASNTLAAQASNALSSTLGHAISESGLTGRGAMWLLKKGAARSEAGQQAAIAEALQDPAILRKLLESQLSSGAVSNQAATMAAALRSQAVADMANPSRSQ